MTVVYGLREIGTHEWRYVGITNRPLAERLHKHRCNARHDYPRRISGWLKQAGPVEIILLAECDPATAHAEERRYVERLHAAGHRLTNGHLLPRTQVAA